MIPIGKTLLLVAATTTFLLASLVLAETAKSEPPSLKVLDSQEVDLGSRSIIYHRVETPLLIPEPPSAGRQAAPVAERAVTQEELEEIQKWESLNYVSLFLSCTVYDGRWTEVRFRHENTDIIFWSTANFNYLSQMADVLTEDTYYSMMMMVVDSTLEDLAQQNAELRTSGQLSQLVTPPSDILQSDPKAPKSEWRITSKAPVPAEAQRAIADLHAHYDANRETLIAEYEARQAARIAHEKWLRENPPQPQDTVIQFFPIQSDHSPTEAQTLKSSLQTAREE